MIAKQGSESRSIPAETVRSALIDSALATVRCTIFIAGFLRSYWISALVVDASAFFVHLVFPALLGQFPWVYTTALLFVLPLAISSIRCLGVRVPHLHIARLIDERQALQDRTATAIELIDSAHISAEVSAMVSEDAEKQLRTIDLRRVVPLKRDAIAAGLAFVATMALCAWHAPEMRPLALISSSGLGTEVGSQPVRVLNPEEQAQTSPSSQNRNPPSTPPKVSPTTPTKPPHGLKSPQSNKNSFFTDSKKIQAQSTGSSQQSNAKSGAGSDRQSTADKSRSSGAKADNQDGSVSQHNADQAEKSSSPASSSKSTTRSGSPNQSGTQKDATQETGSKSNQSSSGASQVGKSESQPQQHGSSHSNSAQGGSASKSSNGQKGGAASNQSSSHPSAGQDGRPNSGDSKSQNSTQDAANAGSSRQNGINGSGGGPASGGSGIGKAPSFDKNRILPPVVNHSTFSFRQPKPIAGGRTSTLVGQSKSHAKPDSLDRAASQVPYGNSVVSVSTAVQARQVEQDPHIPAGYRNLVKQYFGNSAGASSSNGQAH